VKSLPAGALPLPDSFRDTLFDIAVIGGGVNGCGVAREAQGRGASVILLEQGDLAGATSSASTKLVHGGLRYLEHYEFRLVREALMEREVLWAMAPHIIWPLRFVLPHHKGLRPAWLLRLGLFLYDHLGGRKLLPATRTLNLRTDAAGKGLASGYSLGFEYSDAWVEDSRLVVLNAMDARARGAVIRTRTRVTSLERKDDRWVISTVNASGTTSTVQAKILINTAGPWVGQVLAMTGSNSPSKARLVKGSHIVVPRLFQHDRAYIFQNGDGRIVFAIPYERDFTLIGTTDSDYQGDPAAVAASPEEVSYLCAAVSEYLATPVTPDQVVWTYAGVRPLLDDGSGRPEEATRDYVLELDQHGAPVVSVFGGKITTYRRLAEAVIHKLSGLSTIADKPSWSGAAPLPGGDFAPSGFEALVQSMSHANPWVEPGLLRRLLRAYGTRTRRILEGCHSMADLGQDFGAGLTEREVAYLRREEWAVSADDIVWRRSKLGLRLSPEQKARLSAWLETSGH
jgi:glycerol-3-phosphate dehydrogenase